MILSRLLCLLALRTCGKLQTCKDWGKAVEEAVPERKRAGKKESASDEEQADIIAVRSEIAGGVQPESGTEREKPAQ